MSNCEGKNQAQRLEDDSERRKRCVVRRPVMSTREGLVHRNLVYGDGLAGAFGREARRLMAKQEMPGYRPSPFRLIGSGESHR